MTPQHCDQLISRTAYLAGLLERDDVPAHIKLEVELLLNLNEKATRYTPPASSFQADVRAEAE